MTIHHLHAEFDGRIVLHFWVVTQDKGGHSIRQALDDARDDEQQSPKEYINLSEQSGCEDAYEVPVSIEHA